jgi:hypothetical protein
VSSERYSSELGLSLLQRAATGNALELSERERHALEVARFIAEFELGGVSGYFFNTGAAIEKATAAGDAFAAYGNLDIRAVIREALAVVARERDHGERRVWSDVLRDVDPNGELDGIERRLNELLDSFARDES